MRSLLDLIYRAAGGLAALFMIATLAMVLTGIVTRLLDIYVRGTDDYAGYCMAACGFLALAYTFKHGEHIRVTLLIDRFVGGTRHVVETVALVVGAVVAGALAWYSLRLVFNSYEFGDISQGVDATPLWIPQIGMAAGTVVLFVALLDDLLLTLAGRPVARLKSHSNEPARVE